MKNVYIGYDFHSNALSNKGVEGTSNGAVITPPIINTDENDYNPTGLGTSSVLRLSSSVAISISGVLAPILSQFRELTIINVGTSAITLLNSSVLSVIGNRFLFPNNKDITIPENGMVHFQYDTTTSMWRGASGGLDGLSNPVCEIVMEKNILPNTLGGVVNFVHTNNGPEIDVITTGVTEIFRDASQAIYNIAVEGAYTFPTSPQGTEWNSVYTDPVNNGHGNIQNVQSRTYGDFYTALNSSIGNFVLTTPLVMHDVITDKYYLFTFTQWTMGGGGGGFQYTRTEVIIGTVICSGKIIFDDATFMDTAPQTLMPTYAAKSSTSLYTPPVSTGSTSLLLGRALSDGGGFEVFALGTRLVLNGSPTLAGIMALGFFNTINAGSYTGIYILGDSNVFNGSATFTSVIGEQNTITGGTFGVVQGLYNTHNNAQNQVSLGLYNNISTALSSVVVGSNNTLTGLTNSVVIGLGNTAALSSASVNVLNTNFGLKVLSTESGIGAAGFTPTARFHVKGVSSTNANFALKVDNLSDTPLLYVRNDGNVGINTLTPTEKLHVVGNSLFDNGQLTRIDINSDGGASGTTLRLSNLVNSNYVNIVSDVNVSYINMRGSGGRGINLRDSVDVITFSLNEDTFNQYIDYRNDLEFRNLASGQIRATLNAAGDFGIGASMTAPTARMHIKGLNDADSHFALKVDNSSSNPLLYVRNDGRVRMNQLPTSLVGLVAGDLWNNLGVVNIV